MPLLSSGPDPRPGGRDATDQGLKALALAWGAFWKKKPKASYDLVLNYKSLFPWRDDIVHRLCTALPPREARPLSLVNS